MNFRYRPGQLVEVIHACPHFARYIGERFVLSERGPDVWPIASWQTPFTDSHGGMIYAEESCLKPVADDNDAEFQRFMNKVTEPRMVEPTC